MTKPAKPHPRRWWLWAGVGILVLLLAAGWGATSRYAAATAQRQIEALAEASQYWQSNPDEPLAPVQDPQPGQALWTMRIPQLWGEREFAVVVGTEAEQLRGAIGWYSSTAQPGQVGNFAVTGHCRDDGAAFAGLTELPVGSQVQVASRDAVFTYEIISPASELTVNASQAWVLQAVPGQPERVPTHALITLTTCEDRFPTADRAVAFGVLTATEMK